MTSTARVTSPAELAAMVPHLCGFTPTDSAVIVGIGGGRVIVTARMDADQIPHAGQVADQMARAGVESTCLIFYGTAARDWRTLYALTLQRLEVADALEVDADAAVWVSLLGAENGCTCGCSRWQAIPADAAPAVEAIAAGSAPVTSREAIAGEVSPDLTAGTDDTTARALLDLGARDAVLQGAARALEDGDPDTTRRILADLITAARSSTGDPRAMALTTAATVAYLLGEGARANVYAEVCRVENGDRVPTLLPLLEQFLAHAINPADLRTSLLEA